MSSRKRKSSSIGVGVETPSNENSQISPLSRHTRSKDNIGNSSIKKSNKKKSRSVDENNDDVITNSNKRAKKVKKIIDDSDNNIAPIDNNNVVARIENNNNNVVAPFDNNIDNNDLNNLIAIGSNNVLSEKQEIQKTWTHEAHHIMTTVPTTFTNQNKSSSPPASSSSSSLHNNNNDNNNNSKGPSPSSIFTSSSTLPSLFLSSRKKSSISPTIPSLSVTSLPNPISINRITSDPIRIMNSQSIIEDSNTITPNRRSSEVQTPRSGILSIFTPASINKIAANIENSRKSPILFFFGVFIIFSLGALSNQLAKTIYGNVTSLIQNHNMRRTENQHRLRLLDALEKEFNLFASDFAFEENQLKKMKQLVLPDDSQSTCSTPECILQRTKELERNISLIRPTLTSLSSYTRESDSIVESTLLSITHEVTELFKKVDLHGQDMSDQLWNVNTTLQDNEIFMTNLNSLK